MGNTGDAVRTQRERGDMPNILRLWALAALLHLPAFGTLAAAALSWPSSLPVYDHIVVVIEENKDFEQIFGGTFAAPYIKALAAEGASFGTMFGEEHNSQGNYFWLFSGSNQNVGFLDEVPGITNHPDYPFKASSLGAQLIKKGLSFKGYAEDLPAIGAKSEVDPPNCNGSECVYARKHVPWISFATIPNGTTIDTSSNLRFEDFPADFTKLPTVAFVVPNLMNDMHNGTPKDSIPAGDAWLRRNLDRYYQWAKTHNSLLIVTFDENDDRDGYQGLTDPQIHPSPAYPPVDPNDQRLLDLQNRVVTIFAGAHIKPGLRPDAYAEGNGITHVNVLRTIEAMYGLPKSGAQQPNAVAAGIGDDTIIIDVFEPAGQ
jgi:phosphatidylinositol-3-phosphatase